mmetsp:Transcript_51117/g.146765  ORF Transcript_51117/g.146765 Transcript_51117/m.146765 type:complete len:168 (+) Transcript_51117:299-802(+)
MNYAGAIGQWIADDSWLCSGFDLLEMRMGRVSKEHLFRDVQASEDAKTISLRVLAFLIIWCGFCQLAGPLSVAAECVPCVGRFLSDSIQTIACFVSCPPACACAMGVIGVCWIVMRPTVGIILLVVFGCTIFGYIAYLSSARQRSKIAGDGVDIEAETEIADESAEA